VISGADWVSFLNTEDTMCLSLLMSLLRTFSTDCTTIATPPVITSFDLHTSFMPTRYGPYKCIRVLMIDLAFAQLLAQLPNLLGDAAPYFIGIAPRIDGSAIARKGL